MNRDDLPHVVVVGGGFGGLHVVKRLRHEQVEITLVDRNNYHLFRPLLYQVAMGGLSPADIAAPLREIFQRDKNVRTLLAEVSDIDVNNRTLHFADGSTETYDYLIVATGVQYDYFGHVDWSSRALNLDGVENALQIRKRVLTAFEMAEREPDPQRRRAWTTFVVVGGGPTGVELAGAIGEMANYTLGGSFRSFEPAETIVLLVEMLDRVLATFPPDLSAKAQASLESLGVTVRANSSVVDITDDSIALKTDDRIERIATCTVLWAAGVKATTLSRALHASAGVELDRKGRVKVLADLSIPNHPEIMVIGDLAYLEQDGRPLPGVAPVAIQQGRHAAIQVMRAIKGEPPLPFVYHPKGDMATIGRAAAVADIHGIHLSGFFAWLAWLFVHIINLIGFRNRLSVLLQWFWSYITYARSVRLIVRDYQAPVSEKHEESS